MALCFFEKIEYLETSPKSKETIKFGETFWCGCSPGEWNLWGKASGRQWKLAAVISRIFYKFLIHFIFFSLWFGYPKNILQIFYSCHIFQLLIMPRIFFKISYSFHNFLLAVIPRILHKFLVNFQFFSLWLFPQNSMKWWTNDEWWSALSIFRC